ncbi:MAG: hypothetical protein DWQ38_01530 [Acidobacteria bacterium]|nr:MAG: hypothetical protein DWQ38_01530 [Acidobacteriota bacterium]
MLNATSTKNKVEMKRLYFFTILTVLLTSFAVFPQIRPVTTADTSASESPVPENLPETVEVEYQGGIFGFSEKEKGTLRFDVINERLVFTSPEGKERFSIPYEAIRVVYPSQRKVRSGTGRAVGAIPLPGASIAGLFMKKKKNYLVLHYEDRLVEVEGVANFLVDTSELLTGAIHAIGQNAEMTRRGDSYIRQRSP